MALRRRGARRASASNGYVLYDGPSQFTGDRIVVIITGLIRPSTNSKTGPMAQVFILMAGEHPQEAIWNRREAGICGGCKLRPQAVAPAPQERTCYVNIPMQGIASVYAMWHRGGYPVAPDLATVGRAQVIRVGAYGDPAAVPTDVWAALLSDALAWTGYTHAWRAAPALKAWFQASVDTPEEYTAAEALGWGTYRIRATEDAPLLDTEIVCPASAEGDLYTSCRTCLKCNGTSHVAIVVHGGGEGAFTRIQTRRARTA